MNLKSRKFMGFIITNTLILGVTICSLLISPEVLTENAFIAILGGFLINLAVYVFGNVIAKFAPQIVEKFVEPKNG